MWFLHHSLYALVTLGIRGGLIEDYGKQYYFPSHIFCSLLTWLAKLMSLLLWFNRVRGLACCYTDIIRSALVATRIWEFTAFLKYCIHVFMVKRDESRLSWATTAPFFHSCVVPNVKKPAATKAQLDFAGCAFHHCSFGSKWQTLHSTVAIGDVDNGYVMCQTLRFSEAFKDANALKDFEVIWAYLGQVTNKNCHVHSNMCDFFSNRNNQKQAPGCSMYFFDGMMLTYIHISSYTYVHTHRERRVTFSGNKAISVRSTVMCKDKVWSLWSWKSLRVV